MIRVLPSVRGPTANPLQLRSTLSGTWFREHPRSLLATPKPATCPRPDNRPSRGRKPKSAGDDSKYAQKPARSATAVEINAYQGPALDGILPGPLAGRLLVFRAVRLVCVGDLGHQRVVGVRVRQHRADGEQNCARVSHGDSNEYHLRSFKSHTLRYGQCRAPLVTQNVEADAAICVDIGVINPGREMDLWRLERVVRGELDLKEEDTPSIRRVALFRPGQRPPFFSSNACDEEGSRRRSIHIAVP